MINVDGRPSRLQPPRYLNKTEKAVFTELAATGHFVPTDAALLASLAQATVMARKAARDPAKSAVWERAVKMQAMLSTKLRLTPQARIDPKTVGRQRDGFFQHHGSGQMTRGGQKAANWIEAYCVYPHGFDKGQHVRLTVEQKEILRRIFDRNESPGEISAPLSAYLALFHVAGPRDLAAHVSALPLSADTFTTWNAVGLDLRAAVKRDGEHIVCPELGTKFPPVAA